MKKRIRRRIKRQLAELDKKIEEPVVKKDEKRTVSQSKSVTAYKDGELIAEWSSMTKAAEALKMSRVSLKKAIAQETPIDSLEGAILKL